MKLCNLTRNELEKVVNNEKFIEFENTFNEMYPKIKYEIKDRLDWTSWQKPGNCVEVAIGIVYPMLRLLYPETPLKIHDGKYHMVVINEDCYFDPMEENIDFTFNSQINTDEIWNLSIKEENISEWWTTNVNDGVYHHLSDMLCDLNI